MEKRENIFGVLKNANDVVEANAYENLPTVLAGEYAEVLSKYIDKYGNQVVIPPSWTVSKITCENTIDSDKDMCLIIYQIPKEELKNINWKNEKEVKEIKKIYNQLIWYQAYWTHTLSGCNVNIMNEFFIQKASVNKYGGRYVSCYDISKDKITGNAIAVLKTYASPSNFLFEKGMEKEKMIEDDIFTSKGINLYSNSQEKNNCIYCRLDIDEDDVFLYYGDYAVSFIDDGDPCDLRFGSGYHASFYIM